MKDLVTKEKFIELRASGLSYEKIAQQLHLSKQTLINWSKELKQSISNHKTIALDALLEKHCLQKQHQISLYATHLERIKTELSKRDLSEIPTEKLFDLLIKVSSILKAEHNSLEFHTEVSSLNIEFTRELSWPIP